MDSQPPYFNTTLACLLVAAFLCIYYALLTARGAKGGLKKPPEPAGGWPIVGHLPLLSKPQLYYHTFGAMADKYGPIFTLRVGLHPSLVVSTWELAKELFTTNDQAVTARPPMVATKLMGYNNAMFGFTTHGPYWREMRKVATVELLSNRRLEQLKHVKIEEVDAFIKDLYKYWREKKNVSGKVMVELKKSIGELTLNVILRMVAGKRCFGGKNTNTEEEALRWQKVMRDIFYYLGVFAMRDAIPFLGWLDIGGHEKAMKRVAKELDSIIGECLEEHKLKRASDGVKEDYQDFIDVMLSVLDGTGIGGYDADTVIKATCLSLLGGGSDTTMITSTWAISLTLNHKNVLQKVQEELDIFIGKERLVQDSDINKLIYLQAIVKETLRLYPPNPLNGPRQFLEDCTIGGYHVPKGTRLIVNTWKIQRDPRVWLNPCEFKPERFLTSHKDIDVRGNNYELIPFGSGRRACPGISFALQTVLLTLANFLHAFNISTPGNSSVDMTESAGLSNVKATPLEVLISPRLSHHVYA